MQKSTNLQDLFLLRARRSRANVTVFLVNGYQIRGQITGFDSFVVVLMSESNSRSSISTPSPPLSPSGWWISPGRRFPRPLPPHPYADLHGGTMRP